MSKFYLSRLGILILIWATVIWAVQAVTPAQKARHQHNLETDARDQQRVDIVNEKYARMKERDRLQQEQEEKQRGY